MMVHHWGVMTVAMDPWTILTIGVSVGIVLGAAVAAICLVGRPQCRRVMAVPHNTPAKRLRHSVVRRSVSQFTLETSLRPRPETCQRQRFVPSILPWKTATACRIADGRGRP